MKITNNSVVSIHYTLTDKDQNTLDSSIDQEPFSYLQGAGQIVPGLEKALLDKSTGDQFTAVIAPEDGYGLRDDQLVQSVARSAFEGVDNIEPGMHFSAQTENGPLQIQVVAVQEDTVVIDSNHSLAGLELHFSVQILNVREATAEEIEHGHAH